MTEAEALNIFRQRMMQAGGQLAYAEKLGVSAAFVSLVFHGKRRLSEKMLRDLGLRKVVSVTYEMEGP